MQARSFPARDAFVFTPLIRAVVSLSRGKKLSLKFLVFFLPTVIYAYVFALETGNLLCNGNL
jgi:hypothetical protein